MQPENIPQTTGVPPQPAPQPVQPQTPPPAGLPSAFALFRPSIEALKLNLATFCVVVLVPIAIVSLSVISRMHRTYGTFGDTHTATWSIGSGFLVFLPLSVVIFIIFGPAIVYTQLRSVQGQKVSIEQAMRNGFHFLWRWLGLEIITAFLIMFGLLLLIVPGLIVIRRYTLAPYLLMDKDVGIAEALKQSAALTKGRSMAVFGILGVDILISLIGIIPIVGRIVSFIGGILYYNAPAARYEQLKRLPGPVAVPAAPVSAAAPAQT